MNKIVLIALLLALVAGCKYSEVHELPAEDVFAADAQGGL